MTSQTILVTGAAGFIGSHLVDSCVEAGHRVRAFVRYNSRNSWGWLDDSIHRSSFEVVIGDIRDIDTVNRAAAGVDTIFHLAALIGIPYSYEAPQSYVDTNIQGTCNVLQAARAEEVGNVVVTSTSETYGTAHYVPMDERHPQAAQSPYAATKIGADQLALSFARSCGLRVKIARPFNVYGPRQSARAIIPSAIAQLLASGGPVRTGNLTPTRDLTFVTDTVAALRRIADSDALVGTVTNIGSGTEISIRDLVETIGRLIGVSVSFVEDAERTRPDGSEVLRLVCDPSKLIEATGWRPQVDLESGLSATIDWQRAHAGHYKPHLYNV